MNQGRRLAIFGVAVSLVGVVTSCTEHQFLLSVRNPEPIEVSGTKEPASRLPASTPMAQRPAGQPFSDRGVRLHTGSELAYWRDGDWVSSVDPIVVDETGNRITIDFTLHPGHRDLPLQLSLERDNVCELKTRARSDRAAGYAGLVLGATAAVFVPITAASSNEETRHAAPYVGGAAAALLLAGAALLLWPAGAERVIVPPACHDASATP
jgi:hypothetical protein